MINSGEGHSLMVRDKDKKVCTLPNLPPTTAKQMLSVHLSPDGDESTQLLHGQVHEILQPPLSTLYSNMGDRSNSRRNRYGDERGPSA